MEIFDFPSAVGFQRNPTASRVGFAVSDDPEVLDLLCL